MQVPNPELETWGYAQVQQGVKALLTLIEASIGGAVGAGVADRAVQLLNQWAILDPQFTAWATATRIRDARAADAGRSTRIRRHPRYRRFTTPSMYAG